MQDTACWIHLSACWCTLSDDSSSWCRWSYLRKICTAVVTSHWEQIARQQQRKKQQRKITTENALQEKIGVTRKVIRLQRKCRYLIGRMNVISCWSTRKKCRNIVTAIVSLLLCVRNIAQRVNSLRFIQRPIKSHNITLFLMHIQPLTDTDRLSLPYSQSLND